MILKTSYTAEEIKKALERKRQRLKLPEHLTNKQLEDIFHQKRSGRYIGDFVYGANDGIVTTFAVVTGAVGASLSPIVIIILGFANLVADGFSMGISSFLSRRSDLDYQRGQHAKEKWEIKEFPELEVTEVREILADLGLKDNTLDEATTQVTAEEEKWISLMMVYELGVLEEEGDEPWKHGLATFVAFLAAGLMPLIPFLLPVFATNVLLFSPLLSGIALFVTGALRTLITPKKWWIGGLEMLTIGAVAASASFGIGYLLKTVLNI